MAVTILYLSITSVKITHQGNFHVTHAFHNTTPGPLWAPGSLRAEPLRARRGRCGSRPCGSPWALVGRAALMDAPRPSWAGPLWAPMGTYGLGPNGPY